MVKVVWYEGVGLSGVYVGKVVWYEGGDGPVCTWGRWCGVKRGWGGLSGLYVGKGVNIVM